MKTIFNAVQFTPTEFDNAEQKAEFANHFLRFVASDFKGTLFYDWFYKRLSMAFGHIAHYNRHGFYGTFFETTAGKVEFLVQTLEYPCYGSPTHTYSDVERVLIKELTRQGVLGKYSTQLAQERESAERAQLARLKEKYEGKVDKVA